MTITPTVPNTTGPTALERLNLTKMSVEEGVRARAEQLTDPQFSNTSISDKIEATLASRQDGPKVYGVQAGQKMSMYDEEVAMRGSIINEAV